MDTSGSLPVVAIAGATGRLGSYLSEIFLSPEYKSRFQEVVLLTRNKTPKTDAWEQKGARIVLCDVDSVAKALEGVDILINAIGSKGHHLKDKLIDDLPSSVRLYFPSEFGVDHGLPDFTHAEWDYKRDHVKRAQELHPNLRVCQVYCGLFLESAIAPWYGLNTKDGHYEAIGSLDQPFSVTSMEDISRAVAVLASSDVSQVPPIVRLSGDCASMKQIEEIMKKHGAGTITTSVVELAPYKEKAMTQKLTPDKYLRFSMGEGKLNFSDSGIGNDNERVNPGETRWKWKNIEDIAVEHQGRPFKDVVFN